MSERKSARLIPQDVRKQIDQALPQICARAIELIDNPQVAPSAQAQLISVLFRAAGLFNQDNTKQEKEPYEMTSEELKRALRQAKERALALTEPREGPAGTHRESADILG